MRRIFLFSVFIIISIIAKAQFSVYEPADPNYSRSTPIEPRNNGPFSVYTPDETVVNGTVYNATVIYESSSGHHNTYILPVIVNNGSVNQICFPKGGSVHIGINHSGYKYYGGKLEYKKGIDSYVTTVKVVYSNFWQQFTILIG